MRRRAAALLLAVLLPAALAAEDHVTVGSKNFEESRLLAEMFAQLIEQRTGLAVERRFNLAGTQVCLEALRSGAIDIYPEYTGTGLVSILGEQPLDRAATLRRVRQRFLTEWDLWWLAPLGFENAYALAVPQELARREGLRSLSDLARVAGRLRAGLGYEFVERPDGLPGLRRVYGIEFRDVRPMQQTLKYRAVAEGQLDCLDVYTTDGRLAVLDLAVLEDDRNFFPPYEAAPLVRGELLRDRPEVGATLGLLAGALDRATMQRFNLRLQEHGESAARVAADALAELGLLEPRRAAEAPRQSRGLAGYLWQNRRELGRRTLEHLGLSAAALLLGALVAIPLGLWLERGRRVAEPVIRAVAVTQTIPSIALLAFMVPLLGVGHVPALVALWVYSLFPMLRNTYTGVRDAPPEVVEAARALGMTRPQILRRVRLPLALPVVLAGVRTSAVLVVGTATLAAFIGAGGLGVPIVAGLQLADARRILSGAIPAAALAVAVDLLLAAVERFLRPRGLEAPD